MFHVFNQNVFDLNHIKRSRLGSLNRFRFYFPIPNKILTGERANRFCFIASKIFNEGTSTDYLNNVRAVNGIVNENIFN